MSNTLRSLVFPDDRLIGYFHRKEEDAPMEFHGRFTKDGNLLVN